MSSDSLKRSLLAIGVSRYEAVPDSDLLSVDTDLDTLLPVFRDLGFSLAYPDGLRNPTARDAADAVGEWLEHPDHGEHDQLVLYLSGHGVYDLGDFFLVCTNTSLPLKARQALSAQDIIKAFAGKACKPNHLLVIVDACHSGAFGSATGDIGKILDISQQHGDAKKVHYIASSTQRDPAPANSAFALALREAITKPMLANGGASQQFLYMDGIVRQINTKVEDQARSSSYNGDGNVRFFDNPHYDPNDSGKTVAEQNRRRELILSNLDRGHYLPKARGVNTLNEPGNFFTGRHAALRTLVSWLADGQPNALVVTGDPGAGKSSLLGRLVIPAVEDADKRDDYLKSLPEVPEGTIAPTGSIDAGVHARNRTTDQLAYDIADRLGLQPATNYSAADLSLDIAEFDTRKTIVIDALDESSEKQRTAQKLVNDLAAAQNIKVLVGSRRHLLASEHGVLKANFAVLDIDTPEYITEQNLADYLERRLVVAGSPYETKPNQARDIAIRAAPDAYPNFLIARIVADTLVSATEVVDPDTYAFPTNMQQAFEDYLQRFGDNEQRVRDLLRPLAYGEGLGLPTELWLPIANVLVSGKTDTPYFTRDIEWLQRNASDYIVENSETAQASRSVYRLFHQALADDLQAQYALSYQEAQARILTALLAYVPLDSDGQYDWLDANLDPYIQNSLALHAAAAKQLAPLLQQAAFLVVAEPQTLFTAMNSAEEKLPEGTLAVYRKTYHELANANRQHAAEQLAVTALKYGVHDLVDELYGLPIEQLLQARWASWRETPHRVLQGHTEAVNAVSWAFHAGRLWLASGSDDSTVRLWDAETGTALETLEGHTNWVFAVSLQSHAGRLWLASGSDDNTVRLWDAETGELIHVVDVEGVVYSVSFDRGVLVVGADKGIITFSLAGL